jgi:alanine dehydrogenase
MAGGATCIAYETVIDADDGLPLLARMSQIAGRMAIQAGEQHLEALDSGADLLLGGVPGSAQPRCSSTVAASLANTPLR